MDEALALEAEPEPEEDATPYVAPKLSKCHVCASKMTSVKLTSMAPPSQPSKHGARCDVCSAPFRPLERARANPGGKMGAPDSSPRASL